ncbi:MAG: toxin-antitoxin system HicB family antitoxin [Coriobacteriia bacterium]|nr:toxin-antitoxin system HicB family antitoxin [Coriobacteriia bacterium]
MSDRSARIDEYMALEYPVELTRDESGYFVRIPDLPGCESNGSSVTEAMESIEEARRLWIEIAVDARLAVPSPRGEQDYSGKFVVRVARSVHRDLVRIAAVEGVSLNAFVSGILARETGRAPAPTRPHALPFQQAKGARHV